MAPEGRPSAAARSARDRRCVLRRRDCQKPARDLPAPASYERNMNLTAHEATTYLRDLCECELPPRPYISSFRRLPPSGWPIRSGGEAAAGAPRPTRRGPRPHRRRVAAMLFYWVAGCQVGNSSGAAAMGNQTPERARSDRRFVTISRPPVRGRGEAIYSGVARRPSSASVAQLRALRRRPGSVVVAPSRRAIGVVPARRHLAILGHAGLHVAWLRPWGANPASDLGGRIDTLTPLRPRAAVGNGLFVGARP